MTCQMEDVTHIFVVQSKGRSCFLEQVDSGKLTEIAWFFTFQMVYHVSDSKAGFKPMLAREIWFL